MGSFLVRVDLPHAPEVLFRYLAEPRNRPQWQSSLTSVVDVDPGEPHEGMRWRDVTRIGLRPQMRLTEVTPFRTLTETGTWRGIDAVLTLHFVRSGEHTRLTADGRLTGHGLLAVAAAAAGRWAPAAIRADLERASHHLTEHGP